MSDGSAFQARDPAMEKVDKEDKVYGSVSQPFLSNAPFHHVRMSFSCPRLSNSKDTF